MLIARHFDENLPIISRRRVQCATAFGAHEKRDASKRMRPFCCWVMPGSVRPSRIGAVDVLHDVAVERARVEDAAVEHTADELDVVK